MATATLVAVPPDSDGAIGFATDVRTGVICVVFYVIYQQVENYVVYPRVMAKSVDLPGAVIVIAALVGAALLGVVGALLAIYFSSSGVEAMRVALGAPKWNFCSHLVPRAILMSHLPPIL